VKKNTAAAQTGETGMMITWQIESLTWCKVTTDLHKQATILSVLFCRT